MEDKINKMIQTVLSSAEEEAKKIIDLAKKAKERNLRPFKKEAEETKEKLIKDGKLKLELEYERKKTELELKRRNFILTLKQEELDKIKNLIFDKVKEWLATQEYFSFLERQLFDNVNLIEKDGSELLINEKDYNAINKKLQSKVAEIDKKVKFEFNKSDGFILRNIKEHFIFDYTITNLFSQWFDNYKYEILKQIFPREME